MTLSPGPLTKVPSLKTDLVTNGLPLRVQLRNSADFIWADLSAIGLHQF